jgi:hypothetical protein
VFDLAQKWKGFTIFLDKKGSLENIRVYAAVSITLNLIKT